MTSAPATVSSPMLDPLATTHQRNPKLGEPTTVRGAFFEVARRLASPRSSVTPVPPKRRYSKISPTISAMSWPCKKHPPLAWRTATPKRPAKRHW